MFIFTVGLVLYSLGYVMLSDVSSEQKEESKEKSTGSFFGQAKKTERPKDLKDCSYEYVRDNLSYAYYDNSECFDIAKRIRTDTWFRQSIERSMDWGRRPFCEALNEAIEEHGEC